MQTDVMYPPVNQLRLVNRILLAGHGGTRHRAAGTVPVHDHFLAIESSVTGVFLILSGKPENYKVKDDCGRFRRTAPGIYHDVRRKLISRALNLRGPVGRWMIRVGSAWRIWWSDSTKRRGLRAEGPQPLNPRSPLPVAAQRSHFPRDIQPALCHGSGVRPLTGTWQRVVV